MVRIPHEEQTMRAFHLTGPSLDHLIAVDTPTPRPAANEVLVRLHAASLNYLDLAVARGDFGPSTYPRIPVADGAGEVVEVGSAVTRWQPGDRVAPGLMPDWRDGPIRATYHDRLRGVTIPGSLAEYTVVPQDALVRIPDALSYREAATLPVAATTAWNAIVKANIRPGSTVVLLGTGGVSLFALQYARAAGARVIVTSSSDAKLERARALGAHETINYATTPAWDDAVLELTHGAGADLVLESVGAATFPRSLNAVAYAGTIFVIGFVGGMQLDIPVLPIQLKTISILGNNTGSIADFEGAVRALDMHAIKPVIDEVFAFDDAPAAFRHLEGASHVGKIVIDIGS
jgi:NADPH:quinone reductase-like Zn-dependent oxidoreductase